MYAGDGERNTTTSFTLKTVLMPAAADFDEDGDVDATDLTRWRGGFGVTGAATHLQGDSDGDLDVDGRDFLTWQRQLGGPAVYAWAISVPEPTTAILFLAGCAVARTFIRRGSLFRKSGEARNPA
jgi:hypothetical protein